MSNTKEIKKRIKSIKDTHKITNAMYLIASTKLKKAKSDLDQTKPYFQMLRQDIKRIFRINSDVEHRYFYPIDGNWQRSKTYGILVITADKGLAGPYNHNVIKETMKLIGEHPDAKLFVVGEYGRHFFMEHNIKIKHSFSYTAQNPNMHRAREICDIVLEQFDEDKIGKLFVIYTDLSSALVGEAISTRLLPFHRAEFADLEDETKTIKDLQFYPSIAEVLNNTIKSYISGYIYSALIDSFCCEQEARMSAMSSANENAEKLLSELQTQFNRVRQAQITQEITEVSGGARALKERKSNDV